MAVWVITLSAIGGVAELLGILMVSGRIGGGATTGEAASYADVRDLPATVRRHARAPRLGVFLLALGLACFVAANILGVTAD